MRIPKLYIVIFSFLILLVLFFTLILYCNPSIADEDFDLEYKVLNNEKTYFKDRNENIQNFNFNNEFYCNYVNDYKLIIHSLDVINGKERVLFLLERIQQKKIESVQIDYYLDNQKFLNYKIKLLGDSIYVRNKDGEIFFKGKKCR